MNTNTALMVIVALLLGGIGGYALNNKSSSNWGPGMMSQNYDNDVSPMGMYGSSNNFMMGYGGMGYLNGMDHMMAMMVASEQEFIEGMIPHHQEAIDTANEVLERGGTTVEIRTLAQNIVTAQTKEIADMKQWYEDWYGEPYTDTGEYTHMMRELENLSGEDIDRVFLQDMIMHHMGAIMMARSVQPYIEHQEIENLTQAIVSTQSDEIRLMRQLLSGF